MPKLQQVTVFGGSGFLGRHIVRLLAKTGAEIRIPTRSPEKALFLKTMGSPGQIVPIITSTRNEAAVARAIGSSDAVINLLGILYETPKNSFQCIHVETAARLARIAHEQGARRFIQLSAPGITTKSASVYASSKAAGDEAVHTFFPAATIIRPSIVFGAEDNFFNKFSRMADKLPALPLIGGGHTRFQPVYVEDVASAVLAALTRPETLGKTYELGGPDVYTFREMLEILLKQKGISRCLLPLPWSLAMLQGLLFEQLPVPLLTRDQVTLLKQDSVVADPTASTFSDLGITPTPLAAILPSYIHKVRA